MSDFLELAKDAHTLVLEPGRRFPVSLALRGRRATLRYADEDVHKLPEHIAILAARHELGASISTVVQQAGDNVASVASSMRHDVLGAKLGVATEDASPVLRTAVLAAASRGIRTISLEHGISGSLRHQVGSVANVLAVWGGPQADYHDSRQPTAIPSIIGSTRMEKLWRSRRDDRPAFDAIFFAQPAPTLSAANWPEDQVHAWEVVEKVARLQPSWRIAVKTHPAAWAYGEPGPHGSSLQQVRMPVAEILRRTRAVIVVTSTAGAEAMAAGVPVFQLVGRSPLDARSLLAGGAIPVEDAAGLEAALDDVLTNPASYSRAAERGREHARTLVDGIDTPGHSLARLRALTEVMK